MRQLFCWLLIASLMISSIGTAQAQADPPRAHPALLQLAKERPNEKVRVIVQRKAWEKLPEQALQRAGGRVTRDLPIINGFVMELPARAVEALAKSKGVRWISIDAPMFSSQLNAETVRDEFTDISYGGNSGVQSWNGDWQEVGESDGPSSGRVRVYSDSRCAAGNCLRMGGDEVNLNNRGAMRTANLSGATSATLSFSYRRYESDDEGGSVSVQVSADGGTTWTTLSTYHLSSSDSSHIAQSFDISAYTTGDTQIRFLGAGSEVEGYFYFDDIQIEYSPSDVASGSTFYLQNDPVPAQGDTSSHAVLPLNKTAPTSGTLYNYDNNRDAVPGLLLAKGAAGASESDNTKIQRWRLAPNATEMHLQGNAQLTLYTAMKDFTTGNTGIVHVHLLDRNGGQIQTIASATVSESGWSGTWQALTLDFGVIDYTIPTNHQLEFALTVDANSSDDMWFAYGTANQAAHLSVSVVEQPTGQPASGNTPETVTLIPENSLWHYLDNGTDQGTAWRTGEFDDNSWGAGPAQLGYGDGDEATVVSYGPNSGSKYVTTYFRHPFYVSNAGGFNSLTMRVLRDDGIVAYSERNRGLSQQPARRHNCLQHLCLCQRSAVRMKAPITQPLFDPALLVNGENVLAVEIHQANGSSSDISFNLELTGDTSCADLYRVSRIWPAPTLRLSTARRLWNEPTPANGDDIVVAVVDSGINNHKDFKENGNSRLIASVNFSTDAG